jgi:TFIIF-interacting CTD phosphatase-like protein
MSKFFELVIYTASQKNYADKIIDFFDTNNVIKYRLYRESCILNDYNLLIKDLRIFKN